MGNTTNAYNTLVGKPEGNRDRLGDLGAEGRMLLKLALVRKGVTRTRFIWLRIGSSGVLF
jgi:hypothetical protein